jgi:murein DD-endopeptidase MepM/ murein hydrolase activator NlpD
VTRPETAEERAVAVVTGLHGDAAAEVYAGFGEPFRAAVSEAQIRTVIDGFEQKLGPLKDARALDRRTTQAFTTVHLVAFYERGARRYEVTFDPHGTVQGLFARAFVEEEVDGKGPADGRVTKRLYRLPAQGAWYVANGGASQSENHHVGNPQQWYALDLERRAPAGPDVARTSRKNADDPSWNQPVLAPADGVVVTVVNGVPDHEADHTDRYFVPGNTVVLDHGDGEFSVLAHFRLGSIAVRSGQRVKQGDLLGKVGNSGNSSGPHIHWHLATDADVSRGHGLPIRFAPLTVNGERRESPDLVRGDVAENALTR